MLLDPRRTAVNRRAANGAVVFAEEYDFENLHMPRPCIYKSTPQSKFIFEINQNVKEHKIANQTKTTKNV